MIYINLTSIIENKPFHFKGLFLGQDVLNSMKEFEFSKQSSDAVQKYTLLPKTEIEVDFSAINKEYFHNIVLRYFEDKKNNILSVNEVYGVWYNFTKKPIPEMVLCVTKIN